MIDFFVVGMPKCATTSLFETMTSVPDIFRPACKEPSYWDGGISFEKYCSIYEGSYGIVGDFTPSYALSDAAADAIAHLEKAKVILIFREPLDYLRSLIQFSIQRGRSPHSDMDSEYSRDRGYYDRMLGYDRIAERWRRSDLRIYRFEDLVSDQETVDDIFSFVGSRYSAPLVWKNRSRLVRSNPIARLHYTRLFSWLDPDSRYKVMKAIGSLNEYDGHLEPSPRLSEHIRSMTAPIMERLDSIERSIRRR